MGTAAQPEIRKPVQLPRTSSRLQKPAYVKLLSAVRPGPFGAAYEGVLYAPGQVIAAELAGENPIVLECVGPVGSAYQGKGRVKRELQYILWRYEWDTREWIEIARAQSVGPEWCDMLRPAAIAALNPRARLVDVETRVFELSGKVMVIVEQILECEPDGVRVRVLHSIYEGVAGRIAMLV